MSIGTLRLMHNGGPIDIPVVVLGSSALLSKVRVKVPAGVGELSLVTVGDNRQSPMRVRQDGVTYAVARDERTEIVHTGAFQAELTARSTADDVTLRTSLGVTTFNKVTRVEAIISYVGIIIECLNQSAFVTHHDSAQAFGWIEAWQGSSLVASSFQVATPFCQTQHPGGFGLNIIESIVEPNATVAIDLARGQYEIKLAWRGVATGETSEINLSPTRVSVGPTCGATTRTDGFSRVECTQWKEIAK